MPPCCPLLCSMLGAFSRAFLNAWQGVVRQAGGHPYVFSPCLQFCSLPCRRQRGHGGCPGGRRRPPAVAVGAAGPEGKGRGAWRPGLEPLEPAQGLRPSDRHTLRCVHHVLLSARVCPPAPACRCFQRSYAPRRSRPRSAPRACRWVLSAGLLGLPFCGCRGGCRAGTPGAGCTANSLAQHPIPLAPPLTRRAGAPDGGVDRAAPAGCARRRQGRQQGPVQGPGSPGQGQGGLLPGCFLHSCFPHLLPPQLLARSRGSGSPGSPAAFCLVSVSHASTSDRPCCPSSRRRWLR